MTPFVCALVEGTSEPRPHEHTDIAWGAPEQLPDHDLADDVPVVRDYRAGK